MARHRTSRRAMASAPAKMPRRRVFLGFLGLSVGPCPGFLTRMPMHLKRAPHSTVLREFGFATFTRQGQPVSAQPVDRRFLTPLTGFSLWKHDIRIQTLRAVIIDATPSRDSAATRNLQDENGRCARISRRSVVHRDHRSRYPPFATLAARVAAPSSEKHARKMRFRIENLSINRSWVSCDESRF